MEEIMGCDFYVHGWEKRLIPWVRTPPKKKYNTTPYSTMVSVFDKNSHGRWNFTHSKCIKVYYRIPSKKNKKGLLHDVLISSSGITLQVAYLSWMNPHVRPKQHHKCAGYTVTCFLLNFPLDILAAQTEPQDLHKCHQTSPTWGAPTSEPRR